MASFLVVITPISHRSSTIHHLSSISAHSSSIMPSRSITVVVSAISLTLLIITYLSSYMLLFPMSFSTSSSTPSFTTESTTLSTPSSLSSSSSSSSCQHHLSSAAGIVWHMCRVSDVLNAGFTIDSVSTDAFTPYLSLCSPAQVPDTVLTNLLRNGVFAPIYDPFFDFNLKYIPDIATTGIDYYTFIFRSQIDISLLSSSSCHHQYILSQNRRQYLQLNGISYSATVYQDGVALLPEESSMADDGGAIDAAAGMFSRWTYPLMIDRRSSITLGIHVKPPRHHGSVNKDGGGQGGDHEIAKMAATSQYTAGWDWIRPTPDRNTGIYDDLFIFESGPVRLRDPHIYVSGNQQIREGIPSVSLTATVTIIGAHSGGSLHVTIDSMSIHESIDISPNQLPSSTHTLEFQLLNPKLWWPHTLRRLQHLYIAQFSFHPKTTTNICIPSFVTCISDHALVRFGIREIISTVDPVTLGRTFYINGERIFLQGGNWITTDQFLRHATDKKRYYSELRLLKESGLNLVRVWGGGITERPPFYDAADELGMLVFQEFWMTGDNNGRWAGNYTWPLNHHVYLANVKDTILSLRHHPSLLLYCGGNELYPQESNPPASIATSLPVLIQTLDPYRFYIPSSMSNYTNYDPNYALAPADGPYGILSMSRFDERNPGLKFWNGTKATNLSIGFQPEVGSSSFPVYKSLLLFLSKEALQEVPLERAGAYNVSVPVSLDYHNFESFVDDVGIDPIYNIGVPKSMNDYSFTAQLVQYQQYQGLIEGFQQYMWSYYTACIIWKTSSPWPAFRGYLYDSWLSETGGWWGVHAATEGGATLTPVHIQLQWSTLSIIVVNRASTDQHHLVAKWKWFDLLTGMLITQDDTAYDVPLIIMGNSATKLNSLKFQWPLSVNNSSTLLLRLELHDSSFFEHSLISMNEYWLSNPIHRNQSQLTLGYLRYERPAVSVSATCRTLDDDIIVDNMVKRVTVTVTNTQLSGLAFGIRLCLEYDAPAKDSDSRVLPSAYSKNYFSLIPLESKSIDIRVDMDVKYRDFNISVDGWNVSPFVVTCSHHH